MIEEWCIVPDTNGCYECSNTGLVRSVERIVSYGAGTRVVQSKILKRNLSVTGYWYISLSIGGVASHKYVHRLVAQTFLPNPENKPEVNHIDANRLNNNLYNLEWVTRTENVAHALILGLTKQGDNSNFSKYTEAFINFIKHQVDYSGKSQAAISREYGISKAHVCRIANDKARYHPELDDRWRPENMTPPYFVDNESEKQVTRLNDLAAAVGMAGNTTGTQVDLKD